MSAHKKVAHTKVSSFFKLLHMYFQNKYLGKEEMSVIVVLCESSIMVEIGKPRVSRKLPK